MRRLWTLAMLMGALAATAETNYVWIPYLHPGATQWWTNIYALPDEVTNWQGWQAVNENFRRTSNRFVAVEAEIDAGGVGRPIGGIWVNSTIIPGVEPILPTSR